MTKPLRGLVIACCAMTIIMVIGCGSGDGEKSVAKWNTNMPGNPTFEFADDGTGKMSALGISKNFTWRVSSSKLRSNLSINANGENIRGEIKDINADRITLYDASARKNFTFTRAK